MARPAFPGRRARSRSGQLAAFGSVVLLVAAALAVLGGAILPALDAGSRTLVAQSGPTASAVRLQSRLAADPAQQDADLTALYAAALRDVPADVERSLTVDTDVTVDGQPVRVQFLADPSAPDAAELTSGAWPASPGEIAIQDAAAAGLNLAVGDILVLDDRELTVSGTWRATDPAAPRWFGDPAVASGREGDAAGPILVDESVLLDREDTPTARWTMVPKPAALGVLALGGTGDAVVRLDTAVRRLEGGDGVTMLGTLGDTIARASRVTAVAAGVLGLPLVLVAVAGSIVLGLIGRAIAAGRGAEFTLLRARGASLPALTGAAAREAALTALAGAALGGVIAAVVLHVGLPLLGASGDISVPLAVGIPAGVTVLAVVLATIATITELRAPVTGRAESGRAAVIASLGPLALAAVAAGLALAQFLSLGSPAVVRADGTVRTDPVALTAPVLVLLTGALLAPVIAGPLVAVAERFARAGRGILPVLPLRQLARRTRSVAAGVLVIALAMGAVMLAVGFQLGATATRETAERAATGADLRVSLPVRSSVEDTAPGASAASLAGVDGVTSAFAVLGSTVSIGPDAVPVVAADADRLAGLASAPHGFAALATALTAQRGGVPLPEGATELTVTAQLSPNSDVPEGLSYDVLLWLADADGAALRVPLGSAPLVDGASAVTGQIPETAVSMLAVEFRPPAIPGAGAVDITLDGVQLPQGGAVSFGGSTSSTLTSSSNERFFPLLTDTDPIPVAVGTDFAAHYGVTTGGTFTFRVATVPAPLTATITGILPSLPGVPGSLGVVIDLPTLERRAVELGGSVPAANQVWATATDPDATVAAVRASLTSRAEIVSPRSQSPGPVLSPTLALVGLGVAVTAALAVLGFVAVASSIAQRRRVELTPLRSLGLSVIRIRNARAIELVTSAVLAILLGAAAGLATAALVVPGLTKVLG